MSGLADYYKANNSYNSSANSMDNYVANYIAAPIDEFNNKLNDLRAQGSSLVEAGGAIEGLYAGAKGLQSSVKALKGKLSGGDEEGAGEDAGADAGEEGEEVANTFESGGLELGETSAGASSTAIGASEAGGEAAGAAIGEGVGEGVGLAIGATVGEAVPVVGGLVAIGLGLYELFHKKHKPAPNVLKSNQITMRNEVTVPSYDSVIDQPASSSVF